MFSSTSFVELQQLLLFIFILKTKVVAIRMAKNRQLAQKCLRIYTGVTATSLEIYKSERDKTRPAQRNPYGQMLFQLKGFIVPIVSTNEAQ